MGEKVAEYLKTVYGITSMEELDEAIEEQEKVDYWIFTEKK